MSDQEASVSVSSTKWCCPPSWCIAVVTCMSDQEASVSVSSTKRCPPSRCMYQYRRRSTSAQEASVSSTKRCPPSRCISTAVVTCRSTTKHMLGRRYHSPGRTYITCWAVIPFTAAESIGHTACGRKVSGSTASLPDQFHQLQGCLWFWTHNFSLAHPMHLWNPVKYYQYYPKLLLWHNLRCTIRGFPLQLVQDCQGIRHGNIRIPLLFGLGIEFVMKIAVDKDKRGLTLVPRRSSRYREWS